MNFINKLYLKNFKCYRELNIELGRVNIISGKNSSGKSTLIQSILLYANSYSCDNINLQNIQNVNLIGYKELMNVNEENEDFFKIGINSNFYSYREYFLKNNPINNISSIEKESILPIYQIIYLGAERTLSSTQIERFQVENYNPTPNNEYLADYIYIHDQDLKADSYRKILVENLKELGFLIDDLVINKMGRNYQIKIDSKEIEHVGVGLKYVIPLLLAALSNSEKIIIVENPEIHMHPRAQVVLMKQLIRLCKENNNQLIVETHSDHVLNSVRVEVKRNTIENQETKILFVDENNIVKVNEISSEGQLKERYSGIF